MLCIIASHANVWNYFSDNIIGAWSVFVFFFISALFIKQDSKKALNYSRFLKLFIPYLLWCLIGALIYFKFNLHAIYANMVAVFGCNIFNTFPAYGILWFLRELLLLSLVSPLLSKLNDAALLLFTVIFQILGAAYLKHRERTECPGSCLVFFARAGSASSVFTHGFASTLPLFHS